MTHRLLYLFTPQVCRCGRDVRTCGRMLTHEQCPLVRASGDTGVKEPVWPEHWVRPQCGGMPGHPLWVAQHEREDRAGDYDIGDIADEYYAAYDAAIAAAADEVWDTMQHVDIAANTLHHYRLAGTLAWHFTTGVR